MNLRPPVVRDAPVVLAVEEHAGQRRDAEPLDGLARVVGGVDVHDLSAAGRHLKAQRARDARRIEQRVQGQRAGVLGGALEPERREAREFLRTRKRGVDRQRPRRKAVLPGVAADRAKVARAEERRHVVSPVGDELDPESRESRAILHDGGVDSALAPNRTWPGRRGFRGPGRRPLRTCARAR